MLDVKALAQATAAVVRELVPAMLEHATGPLLERIAQLEAREPMPGKDVDIDELAGMINRAVAAIEIPTAQAGRDGKDVDMTEVRSLVLAAVANLPPPQPGKDADPELVRSLVAEAVAAIDVPEAQPGKDVDMNEVRALILASVADLPPAQPGKDADPELVRALVAEAVASVKIPEGKPGKDVDLEQVRALVQSAVDALPAGQPGRDADPELVRSLVIDAVAAIELPQPRDGKDADPAAVKMLVDEAVAALPPPAPVESLTGPVAALIRDEVVRSVADAVAAIPPAKDGVGAAGAVIDRNGSLVLTLSDGKMIDLGRVDGKDGLDGTSPEDMAVELLPDGRTVRFVFAKGEKEYAFKVPFPVVLDRGVFKEGTAYEHGDAVTFGGSLWIAQRATGEKPEGNNTGWRLAVKKGRDGRDLHKE